MLTHKISGRRHSNLPVCPLKYPRSWSHMCAKITDGKFLKEFFQFVQKQQREGNGQEKN